MDELYKIGVGLILSKMRAKSLCMIFTMAAHCTEHCCGHNVEISVYLSVCGVTSLQPLIDRTFPQGQVCPDNKTLMIRDCTGIRH